MVYISGSIKGARKGLRRASTKFTRVASLERVLDAVIECDDSFEHSARSGGESNPSASIRRSSVASSLRSS